MKFTLPDLKRHARYNKILLLCKDGLVIGDLFKSMTDDQEKVRNDCIVLMNLGFMKREMYMVNKLSYTFKYTTLRDTYPIEEMLTRKELLYRKLNSPPIQIKEPKAMQEVVEPENKPHWLTTVTSNKYHTKGRVNKRSAWERPSMAVI